jgi:Tfp pilus assembly protein PilZ
VPAKFKINYIHEQDYIISYTRDISVDGMFVYTQNPPGIGEITKLTFSIGELKKLTVDARVMWVNDATIKTDSGIGVKFIKPPAVLKKAIIDIVNRVAVLPGMKQACKAK